jgi:hypothetical protein
MKNLFTRFSQLSKRQRRILIALIAVCLIALYIVFARVSTQHFGAEYSSYAVLAKVQEQAVYLPTAPNNPTREQLNLALADALQKNVVPAKRLVDAKRGIDLLKELDAEVDVVGSASDAANAMLAKLQTTYLDNPTTSDSAHALITLAKQRAEIIEDIRGLSYRADFSTRKIFERILTDKGALTAAHIIDLNNELPEAETQFDRRSALYKKLGNLSALIDRTAIALWPDAPSLEVSE